MQFEMMLYYIQSEEKLGKFYSLEIIYIFRDYNDSQNRGYANMKV